MLLALRDEHGIAWVRGQQVRQAVKDRGYLGARAFFRIAAEGISNLSTRAGMVLMEIFRLVPNYLVQAFSLFVVVVVHVHYLGRAASTV
jgi:hypothetical protein